MTKLIYLFKYFEIKIPMVLKLFLIFTNKYTAMKLNITDEVKFLLLLGLEFQTLSLVSFVKAFSELILYIYKSLLAKSRQLIVSLFAKS